MVLAAGALLICAYAVALLVRFTPVYVPVECHGVDQPAHAVHAIGPHGHATMEEPIIRCFNRNPYDLRIVNSKSGQVFAMPGRVPIGWSSVQPLVLPARGSASFVGMATVRTGGRTGEFEVLLEFTTRGYSEMGLFMTVVTATFEQTTTCSMAMRVEANTIRRGLPVCAASVDGLPSSRPTGLEGTSSARAFELNLDREAFRKANHVMQAICGLLMGISAMLGLTTCFAGSWLLIWRRRTMREQQGVVVAFRSVPAVRKVAAPAFGDDSAPDDSDPPPVSERPESQEWAEQCASYGMMDILPFDVEKGQGVAEPCEVHDKNILRL